MWKEEKVVLLPEMKVSNKVKNSQNQQPESKDSIPDVGGSGWLLAFEICCDWVPPDLNMAKIRRRGEDADLH